MKLFYMPKVFVKYFLSWLRWERWRKLMNLKRKFNCLKMSCSRDCDRLMWFLVLFLPSCHSEKWTSSSQSIAKEDVMSSCPNSQVNIISQSNKIDARLDSVTFISETNHQFLHIFRFMRCCITILTRFRKICIHWTFSAFTRLLQ